MSEIARVAPAAQTAYVEKIAVAKYVSAKQVEHKQEDKQMDGTKVTISQEAKAKLAEYEAKVVDTKNSEDYMSKNLNVNV